MASTLDRQVDLKHYARILWRRRGILLLSVVSVLSATVIGLRIIPRQYESVAVLSIEERVPLSRRIEEVLGDARTNTRAYGYEQERLARIVSSVRSRTFLERVVRVLRMTEDPKLLEAARERRKDHPELTVEEVATRMLVESLQARIQVSGAGPGLFRFAVRDYNPDTARLLARWISELFIDTTTKQELDRIRAQRNFSVEQLRIYEQQVQRSEEALRRFRESLIGNALENNPVTSANLPAAEMLQRRLQEDETTARARLGARGRAAIEAGLPVDDGALRADPAIVALAEDLEAALHAYSVARLGSGSSEAASAAAGAKLAEARTDLYRALENAARARYEAAGLDWSRMADYVFAQLDADVHGRAATEMNLLISDAKRRLRNEPGNELELARLTGELEENRRLLESFRSQMVASDLQQAVETTDLGLRVTIIDPAQLPLDPAWPKTQKILVLALLMGPLVGIGFALLAEVVDPTLRSLEDIQRIAPEPVLGTLPLVDDALPVPGGMRRRWVPITVAGVVLVTVAFFVTKDRILPDVGRPAEAVQATEPVEGIGR